MTELKEGVYIAQGPETNVLVKIIGQSPFSEIVGAIDLNAFCKDGTVRKLTEKDVEVQDILSCPEKYRFEVPSLTEAVNGVGMIELGEVDIKGLTQSEEEIIKCTKKIKELDCIYERTVAETKMKIWLKNSFNYSLSQGEFIIKKLRAKLAAK